MTVDDAIESVLRALRDIHDTIPRCSRCENYLNVVAQVRLELNGLDRPGAAVEVASEQIATALKQLDAAREQLDAWIAEAETRVRTTNNCEVCVPRGPFERFIEALSQARG